MTIIREQDREILRAILREVGQYGDPVKDVASMCGVSVQRIVAVAKRYQDCVFRGGRIVYTARERGMSWRKSQPGIQNPRTGVCASIPAEIAVVRKRDSSTRKGKP